MFIYLDEVERKPTESEKDNDDNHHFDHLSIKRINGGKMSAARFTFCSLPWNNQSSVYYNGSKSYWSVN